MNGDIVWTNGPFLCGIWNDWQIFKEGGLMHHLDENERVEADDGYAKGDPQYCRTRSSIFHPEDTHNIRNQVRARHETVNKRMKQFGALSHKFVHKISKHGCIFRSVAVLTQLTIDRGDKLFEIEGYSDFNI